MGRGVEVPLPLIYFYNGLVNKNGKSVTESCLFLYPTRSLPVLRQSENWKERFSEFILCRVTL